MEKNRKILVSILAFVMLSVVFALIDINMNMSKSKTKVAASSGFLQELRQGIGVVHISGVITMNSSTSGFNQVPGAQAIVNRLDELQKDSRIKAIVIRIDSPGGTVGATQEIYDKIIKIKDSNKNIPIVASMGDLAASGGYYVAAACDEIYANQGTITGSIGVIIRSTNLKGLFEQFGIKMNVIKSGKFKDILSSSRDMSEDEKIMLQEMIDSTYNQFVKDVAFGRKMAIDDVKPYADGRIMNGTKAKQVKLIDEIGTLDDALLKAKKLAKLADDAPVYYKKVNPFKDFIQSVQLSLGLSGIKSVANNIENTTIIEYRYIP